MPQEMEALTGRATGRLRERRGASLALALVLFLACVSLGMVLVTAGTAAAGGFSGREELDRRYYCVTSAVELLRERFDGQGVRVRIQDEETRYLDEYGDPFGSSQHVWTVSIPRQGGGEYLELSAADGDFLTVHSLRVIEALGDADWSRWTGGSGQAGKVAELSSKMPAGYTIEVVEYGGTDKSSFDDELRQRVAGLRATVGVSASGRGMKLEVSNAHGDGDPYYKLTMDFAADVLKETSQTVDRGADYIRTTRRADFTVNWKLRGVSG